MIYFDFRKAFDTVPHARLFLKLKEYGINDNLLHWLSGYLSNRKQHVSVNGHFSQLSDVTNGVPQGSVQVLIVHYCKLFCCIKSELDVVQLQYDTDALLEWSKL